MRWRLILGTTQFLIAHMSLMEISCFLLSEGRNIISICMFRYLKSELFHMVIEALKPKKTQGHLILFIKRHTERSYEERKPIHSIDFSDKKAHNIGYLNQGDVRQFKFLLKILNHLELRLAILVLMFEDATYYRQHTLMIAQSRHS